jgi:phosphonate transport system substrate-binding protein
MKYLLFLVFIVKGFYLQAQELTLATYQYADNNRIQNITPLAEHLQKTTGITVKVKSYATVQLFIEGIQNNEVDIALINTFGYLLLNESGNKHQMKPVAALKVKPGAVNNYTTSIIASSASVVNSLKEVKANAHQLSLMLVNIGSTSGNLVPRLALSNAGISDAEKSFKKVMYVKTHAAAVDSAAANPQCIAAMGSTEYFSFISNPVNKEKIKLLWLSPEIPLGPVMIKKTMDKNLQQKIIANLLHLHEQNKEALEKVKAGWSEAKNAEQYILITDNYYNPFRKELGKKKDLKRILEQFAN